MRPSANATMRFGYMPSRTSSPAALADKMRAEELRWKKLIDERGLKVE